MLFQIIGAIAQRERSLIAERVSAHAFQTVKRCSQELAKALEDTGLEYFWIYDLRHTLASRLTHAGVSPIFVAQIIGHSSPSILSTYARAIDQFKRDAIQKLENLRGGHGSTPERAPALPDSSVQ